MAQKKKSTRSRATAPARSAEDDKAMKGGNALTGAVFHGGRMYDHRKASDQRAFAALVEKEGLSSAPAGAEKSDKSKSHKENLQALADQGVLKGYGTKASKKKGDEEDTGDSTSVGSADEAREAGDEG